MAVGDVRDSPGCVETGPDPRRPGFGWRPSVRLLNVQGAGWGGQSRRLGWGCRGGALLVEEPVPRGLAERASA